MKKLSISIFFITSIALFISCGNQTGNSKTTDKAGKEQTSKKDNTMKSPVGTYNAVEDGKPMQFVLNADGTGVENYQGTEKRPFKWKTKDEGIFFTYEGEAQEFQLPIDLAKGEIAYGTLVYKKE